MGKTVSTADKERAQALFAQGKTYREIAKELGGRVSPASVNNWARSGNWQKGILPVEQVTPDNPQIFESANASADEVAANTRKFQEGNRRRWVEQKAEMADKMAERIEQLLDQAFSPHVLKEVKLVGMGEGRQRVEIIEVPYNEPPPADKVKLLTGLAILVDKASLLVGDATSRVETNGLDKAAAADRLSHISNELEERRQRAAAEAAKRGQATG